MANKSTFIKIDRSILNWGWYKDVNTYKLFTHLLIVANIKDNEFMGHTIKRGQYATSYKSLAGQTGLTIKQVRVALEHLKATREVACHPTPKFSIITINNYDYYQSVAQSTARKRHDDGTQTAREGQQSKNIRIKEEKNSAPAKIPEGFSSREEYLAHIAELRR